ncbi:MAG: flagellar assembly protein FliH, partial [Alphaproteobacteria bacterium CG_4_10_14_0_8_um_filter_53_9]
VVEEAEEGVKLTRKEYIEACKELDIMEKHKELWAKKVRDELSKKEEREMEEI